MKKLTIAAIAAAIGLAFSAAAMANSMSKAEQKNAEKNMEENMKAEYKPVTADCDPLQANAKNICMSEESDAEKSLQVTRPHPTSHLKSVPTLIQQVKERQ
jgi:hypothetical protein